MDIQNLGATQNTQALNATEKTENTQLQPQKVDLSDPIDTVEFSLKSSEPKSKGSTSKKIGVGIASALYPGLGQLANGDGKKGAKFFFGQMASDIAFSALTIALAATNPAVALAAGLAGGLTHLGISIGSIVDAVKNAE